MLRVVLDTNVLLSALLFEKGRLAWLRHAWQQEQLQPLACRQTVDELLRVLAYPKFRLAPQEQQVVLADCLPWLHTVLLPDPWPELPVCRDEKDQMFLALAYVGQAQALVTGDQDLLVMQPVFPVPIMTPEALRSELV